MKCVTYNIQFGLGRDGHNDIDRIISEVEGADIIALQEVERFWPRSGNVDQVKQFAEHFTDHYWIYGPGVDLHVEGARPSDNQRRQFGNMVLSRYPILHSRIHLLPKRGSIDPLSIQRCAVETTIRVDQTLLRVYSLHLTHLSPATRLPQIEKLLQIHRDALYEGYPVQGSLSVDYWNTGIPEQPVAENAILFGDFNFQPDTEEYQQIVGPICDYGGHVTSPTGFVDAWCQAGGEKHAGFTSEVNDQPARLDYCFVSSAIRGNLKSCRVDETATGSDHLPVWAEFEF